MIYAALQTLHLQVLGQTKKKDLEPFARHSPHVSTMCMRSWPHCVVCVLQSLRTTTQVPNMVVS